MIELKKIKKEYIIGEEHIHALKGIDLKFRDSEFVSILGPSGCGKTTLLNIIGGLDKYDGGDLIINGESTKDFTDRDFDYYRNYSVGFVFQSYNLIPHQTVLANVEMSLTISGYSKEEKREKALKVLKEVGLESQVHKKPSQLSGGQMQRVAIARAIVNDPDIILADEPTGALDSKTSLQIMNLLKKISKDKLIVMVTHNPELAENYSNRIIKLLDGQVVDDSNPYNETTKSDKQTYKNKKTQMKFTTALELSFNNLMTKKGRTFLTAFAGSVGIIGIALILSLSSGMQNYINKVEEETLSSYPLTIEKASVDMSTLMQNMMQDNTEDIKKERNKVYSRNIMTNVISTVSNEVKENNLELFKKYLDKENNIIRKNATAIQYSYNLDLNLYKLNSDSTYYQTNPSQVLNSFGQMGSQLEASPLMMSTNVWRELLDNENLLKREYDVVKGNWPKNYNEVVLILGKDNEISDYTLYTLGIKDSKNLKEMYQKLLNGEKVEEEETSVYSYDDFLNLTYKLVLNSDYYKKENGVWTNKVNDTKYMEDCLNKALDIKIVGIIKPAEESNMRVNSYGEIGYLSSLTRYVIEKSNESQIVKEQKDNKDKNIFTGSLFSKEFSISSLTMEQKRKLATMNEEEKLEYIETLSQNSTNSYEENLVKLGAVDVNSPSVINIYPLDFESKDTIKDAIEKYNSKKDNDKDVIEYSDIIGTMMSSVTKIINIISYVLIAFVSISLVVSSIMISIITYISVLERTKEIGILRAMGTSKKDISKIFNAETFIEGLSSGILGIVITILICIPANIILKNLINISNIAKLPLEGAIILIIISVILNVVAGLIPSKLAAKKDPAVVLRSE